MLTTIIGYSDLILASPENSLDTLAEDVGEIRDAAERASSLTKQILAFSRRQALQPRVLSLNTVISSTERLLARTIGADVELRGGVRARTRTGGSGRASVRAGTAQPGGERTGRHAARRQC